MAEDDEPDDPARAFKDMAAEVAVLRRAVEAFGEQLERVKPATTTPRSATCGASCRASESAWTA